MTTNEKVSAMATDAGPTASAAVTSDPADKSVGDLVRNLSEDLSRLVRDEIRLAQAEVGEKAKKAGIGIGAFGGAGVVALYGLGVLHRRRRAGPGRRRARLAGGADRRPWCCSWSRASPPSSGAKKLQQAAPPVPTRAIASTKADVAEIKESIHR